jgi:hypothetical protein
MYLHSLTLHAVCRYNLTVHYFVALINSLRLSAGVCPVMLKSPTRLYVVIKIQICRRIYQEHYNKYVKKEFDLNKRFHCFQRP